MRKNLFPGDMYLSVVWILLICFTVLSNSQELNFVSSFSATGVDNGLLVSNDYTGNDAIICEVDAMDNDLHSRDIEPDMEFLLPDHGFKDVSLHCLGSFDFNVEETRKQYVGFAITGEDTSNGTTGSEILVPLPLTGPLSYAVTFENGTDVNFTVKVLENPTLIEIDTVSNGSVSNTFTIGTDYFPTGGLYTLEMKLTNPIGTVTNYVVFAMQNPITNPDITLPQYLPDSTTTYVIVNSAVDFLFTADTGDDMMLTATVEHEVDGLVDVIGDTCIGTGPYERVLTYNFPETKTYTLILEMSNYVNSHSKTYTIISYHKVNSLTLTVSHSLALSTTPVAFTIDIANTAQFSMGEVTCEFNFGDDTSETQVIDCDVPDFGSLTFTPSAFQHTYSQTNWYRTSVVCRNPLPDLVGTEVTTQTFDNLVVILYTVENLVIDYNSPNISHHPFSNNFGITIALSSANDLPLYNITCTHDYGEKLFADVTNTTNLEFEITFVKDGLNPVSINCSNQLSYQILTLPESVNVYYDCWGEPVTFFSGTQKNVSTPMRFQTNIDTEIIAAVNLTGVCQVNKITKWKVFKIIDGIEETTSTFVDEVPSVKKLFKALTMDSGLYRVEYSMIFQFPNEASASDSLYMQLVHPNLIGSIFVNGLITETVTEASIYETLDIDASSSEDPVSVLPSVNSSTESFTWMCKTGGGIDRTIADQYMEDYVFPAEANEDCPVGFLTFKNDNKSKVTIAADTMTKDQWYILKMRYARGDRETFMSKVFHAVEGYKMNAAILCLHNCRETEDRIKIKLASTDLVLNVTVFDQTTPSNTLYFWTLETKMTVDGEYINITGSLNTHRSGFSVNKTQLGILGGIGYRVSCKIHIPSIRPWTARKLFVSNLLPYGGECTTENVGATLIAGVDNFCYTCTGWKDEGMRAERNEALDVSEPLSYRAVQYFLDAAGQINESIDPFKLAPSANGEKCFTLANPPNGIKRTQIKVFIYDALNQHVEEDLGQFDVEGPVPDGTVGEEAATIVQEFATLQLQKMNDLDSIGDASTISELAATAVTALPAAPKVERNTQNVDEIPLDKQIVFDMPDGKPLSSEDLADDLKQKEEPPEARAIEEATANVTRKFKESLEKEASGVALSAGTAQRYAQALSALASGKKENFNKNSLDNVVSLSETVFAMMNNEASDPSSDDDVTNDMLVMIKKVGSTVAPEDAVEPSDEKSLHQADKLAEHFASAETLEKREQSRVGANLKTLVYKQQKKIKNLDTQERLQNTKKLARNTETFSRTVTEKATLVDGTAASYGGNGAQIDIVQDSGNLLSQKTMKGGAASFKVPSLASTKSSVRTSILTTETVMKLNEDGSDNGVTSDQYTIAISTNENLDGGSPTQITMPAKMPPPSLITLNPNEDDASGFGTYMETTCEKGSDIVLVFDNDVEVYIRCDGSGNENKVSVINYDAKQIVVEGQVHFTQDEIACNLDDPICSVGIKSNSNEQTSSGGRTRRSTEEQTMNVTVLSLACKTFDDSTNTWRTDECKGKLNPITEEIDCSCIPKKELTVANSFYVPPNMIDFSSVFLKFSPLNQAAVMSVLILILIIYVIIVIWARRQDRKDLLKWGITPMSDNFSEDNYFYVIKVFTGMRPGAGTRSRVSMVIAGEEMDTGVRELADGVREEFGTGSVMNFLMSASSYLGDLDYIRVWHDNSGSGNFSSWYLSKIEVHDIQRNEMFVFLAERWLAVEQDDGLLECVLPVCKNENLNKFKNRFFLNAKDNLAESHIWVSVAYRPQASNFTRVQRASVALLFVMLTMIANAMFFKTSDEGNYETPSELQVGPFRFSLKQVYTSIICALIVTPPTIIVIYLFKLAKNKIKPNEKLFKPRHRGNGYKVPFMSSWLEEEQKRSMELERHLVTKGIPTNEGFRFPHAVVYIAWLLVISGSVLSAFFVMLYSMEWGKQKSEEWVTTFLLSFVESVFCLDPIKVGIMALVFALIFRSTQNSETPVDRGTIMKNYSTSLRGKSGGVRLPAPPLDSKKLENARSVRQRELLMKTAFRDIIINVVMIWILFSISYSNRDTRSYDMLQEVHNQLLDPINLPQFTKIKSINEYFDWLRNTAIVNMFPETEIDGNRTELHWRVRQFIQGGVLFRVGPPRLRQLRTTKKKCKNPYFGEEDCFKKYVQTSEDTEDYCLGWKHEPCSEEEQIYKFSYDAWKFTSALDIWGLPITGFYTTYGGGGYIAKLDVNREISNYILDELYNNSWVDRQTRSVLFEFTLYCLNANIFTYNMFMVEFPETGGAIPFYNIFPLTIYQHIGPMGMYTLLCEVIFAFYQLVCTICIIVMIVQQKKEFFKKPWQVYDFIFTILGYVAIIMYVIRYVFVNMSLDIFREDKRQFVNFYHIAIWNQSFVLLIGVLVFMATLRMLNILGYNKRISALARVFTEAANELIWFGIFFLYVFTCYSAFGYLLFGSKLKSYMNVFKAMGTLFISMIGKSRFTEIDNTDPIMSKIYFVIFIFFVVYMILTMFLAILSKAIDQVHAEAKKDKGDEMVDYVIKKVTGYLSYGSRSKKSTVNPIKAQYRTTSAKKKKFHVDSSAKMDHREILQEIRMTMNDAITTNPRDFTTPCDEKQEKKVKFRR